jgi:hypothetical protein
LCDETSSLVVHTNKEQNCNQQHEMIRPYLIPFFFFLLARTEASRFAAAGGVRREVVFCAAGRKKQAPKTKNNERRWRMTLFYGHQVGSHKVRYYFTL